MSREKSFELLVELWNDETNQETLMVCRRDDNLSPGEAKKNLMSLFDRTL